MKSLALRIVAVHLAALLLGTAAQAQDGTWIQLEAQPTRTAAETRVRVYADETGNVAGFALGSSWFAIVSGPHADRDAATAALGDLRRAGLAPGDAFLTDGEGFGEQFWPVAGATPTVPQTDTAAASPDIDAPAAPQVAEVVPTPSFPPDETVQEARVSEQALNQSEKEMMQTALAWAGFYDSTIDGAFGRGTRGAMEAWQLAQGFTPTGVLTTAQRAQLVGAYDAVLDGMALQLVRNSAAGVEVMIPTGVVSFTEYEPPFARYGPKGDIPAQVLLISQDGDQNRLFGLYEILQTLAIFPPDGDRTRQDASFEIAGQNTEVQSYVTARLDAGQIKGFALVWPAGDTARFSRLRDEMMNSFNPIDGVLDPAIARPDEDQAIDLVAGLQIRKPKASRTGFYIDATGRVLTDASAVASCDGISIDGSHRATVTLTDDALGIAVLTPDEALSPLSVAAFQTQVPRLQTEIAVAGYPYGGVLVTPTLTFGRLADIRGLNGEEDVKRLSLTARDGDAGGPVFDNGGAVLGMLLPKGPQNGQMLPPDVSFLVDADRIVAALDAAGIATDTTDTLAFMPPETLTLRAAESTVLVSCW
ncbi:serine protease [Loktanella sp. DJP18]|uniref:serine protease n=1 Tax=Loktanella sp. DJP18 TaxID=3409788 RepID=UPI003BB626F6